MNDVEDAQTHVVATHICSSQQLTSCVRFSFSISKRSCYSKKNAATIHPNASIRDFGFWVISRAAHPFKHSNWQFYATFLSDSIFWEFFRNKAIIAGKHMCLVHRGSENRKLKHLFNARSFVTNATFFQFHPKNGKKQTWSHMKYDSICMVFFSATLQWNASCSLDSENPFFILSIYVAPSKKHLATFQRPKCQLSDISLVKLSTVYHHTAHTRWRHIISFSLR